MHSFRPRPAHHLGIRPTTPGGPVGGILPSQPSPITPGSGQPATPTAPPAQPKIRGPKLIPKHSPPTEPNQTVYIHNLNEKIKLDGKNISFIPTYKLKFTYFSFFSFLFFSASFLPALSFGCMIICKLLWKNSHFCLIIHLTY